MIYPLLIIAFVFFGISLTFLSCIVYTYIKKYKCRQKENKLKREINDLLEYNFEKINIPIEHISYSEQKPEFENMKELFNKFAYEFNNKLESIKQNVYLIPKILNNYDWKSFNIVYDETIFEILMLKKSISSIFDLHQNLLKYRDYISYILVTYRENGWNLINFFNKNLSDKSNDKIKNIKSKIKNLKKNTEKLNDCIENYDINAISNAINNMNDSFVDLIKVIGDNFIIRKQNNYINYSINEIKTIISKNHQNLRNSEVNQAQKEISKVENNRDYLVANANNLDDTSIEKITISLIKVLSKVKTNLNITFKSSEFFNENKSDIDRAFKNMVKVVPLILKTFEKIFDNFIEDRQIKDMILKCNSSFSMVLEKLGQYFNISNKSSYNPAELLERARNIIELIIDTLSLADRIVMDVDKKYEYSKKILNDITANKLVLTQMKAFVIENKISIQSNIDLIDRLNIELDNIENDFFNDKSNNLEYNFASLSDTKSEISALKINLTKQEQIKVYIEKIINYACLQMTINEDIKYKLKKPIELYNQGQYKESINLLIGQLRKN